MSAPRVRVDVDWIKREWSAPSPWIKQGGQGLNRETIAVVVQRACVLQEVVFFFTFLYTFYERLFGYQVTSLEWGWNGKFLNVVLEEWTVVDPKNQHRLLCVINTKVQRSMLTLITPGRHALVLLVCRKQRREVKQIPRTWAGGLRSSFTVRAPNIKLFYRGCDHVKQTVDGIAHLFLICFGGSNQTRMLFSLEPDMKPVAPRTDPIRIQSH